MGRQCIQQAGLPTATWAHQRQQPADERCASNSSGVKGEGGGA
jgi:hypothetical protein